MFGHLLDKPRHAYNRASACASDTYERAKGRAAHWYDDWRPSAWQSPLRRREEKWTAGDVGGEGVRACLWMAFGAALMYLFDPQQGRRRRAMLRDQFVAFNYSTRYRAADAGSYVYNRAAGRARQLKAAAQRVYEGDQDVSDETLVARVRSALGRHVSHAGSINVTANDGLVVLSGPVLAHEVDGLLASAQGVRGVKHVDNRLEVHDRGTNVPGLQGQSASN